MAAPSGVTLHKSPGRLKDGDDVMTFAIPEMDGKYRFEKVIFRVMTSGRPVLVIRTAPDKGDGTAGAFGDENIKQAEYFGNYTGWANLPSAPLIKKLLDANIFATGAELTGQYSPTSRFPTSPTSQETDYMIDADGVITKSPKPASSSDVKDGQDKQNALLGQIAQGLTGGSSTSSGSTTTTATQKIVRVALFVLGGGLILWGVTKLVGKKKK
ncbi:hypothetical protein [Siphonobacter sp.]|uniref:hypothetical protein n=1 Tax=Siphonobacter sp. TaxID=1869184 RepID=UPI003B3B0BA1